MQSLIRKVLFQNLDANKLDLKKEGEKEDRKKPEGTPKKHLRWPNSSVPFEEVAGFVFEITHGCYKKKF